MVNLDIDDLGKCYIVSGSADEAGAPEGVSALGRGVSVAKRWLGLGPAGASRRREFWALRHVSFQVEPGTILGVIGANGAGKSTLLKVLARVTPPTEGRVTGTGRVVSLLELGAGFDPDVSARENVFMNAAINGLSKADAMACMDDIFAFAEIDQFADQPLKHFSSGMYLRLAFSVAINMRPSILLADEILAVGDAAFQERCLQKVAECGRQGLSVLFVSHDMDAIMRVCNRVLWMNKGTVAAIGEPEDVVADYQDATWMNSEATRFERGRQESRFAAIRGVKLVAADGREIGAAPISEDVYIRVDVEVFKPVSIKSSMMFEAQNQILFRSDDTEYREAGEAGFYSIFARIPAHFLADINYSVTVSVVTLREGELRQYTLVAYNALSFMAYAANDTGSPQRRGRMAKAALLAPKLDWRIEALHAART
ncbi:MAG: polysaccharide ABC transporter ATP-binding protein [Vicinamibacterales bacterium]